MINLLPPRQKKDLKEEEFLSLILILGIVVLAFLLSLSLILFAIKTSFTVSLEQQEAYIEQKKEELKKPVFQEMERKIKEYNLILSQLEDFYKNQPDLTLTLEEIFELFPAEIYFNSLNFNPQTFQVSLSGLSANVENLVQFKEDLENTAWLKGIVLAPSDWWLKTTNINFKVDFKIEK